MNAGFQPSTVSSYDSSDLGSGIPQYPTDLFGHPPFFQEISNRTHGPRTPKPEYLIALATCLRVRWGSVPFNFRIRPRSGCQIVSAVKCRCWVNTFQCLDLEFKPWWMKQATGWWQLKYFELFSPGSLGIHDPIWRIICFKLGWNVHQLQMVEHFL